MPDLRGCRFGEGFEGDPVDVVTGTVMEDVYDFAFEPVLVFRRTYSSARNKEDNGLGRGWRHNFDHRLVRGGGGIIYVPPEADKDKITFPLGLRTNRFVRNAHVLVMEDSRFILTRPDGVVLVFENAPTRDLRLFFISVGGSFVSLEYDAYDARHRPCPMSKRLISLKGDGRQEVFFRWEGKHLVSAHVMTYEDRSTNAVNLVRYFYQGDLLVEVENTYKHRLKYEYDAEGRLTKKTDRKGYSFTFDYDRSGRCKHSAGQDGVLEVTLKYLPFLTEVTRGDGGVWKYHYNQFKAITILEGPEGYKRTYVRSQEDGKIKYEVDGARNKIDYEYDEDGALIGFRDALGRPLAEEREHPVPSTPLEYELGHLVPAAKMYPEPTYIQTRLPPEIASLLIMADWNGKTGLLDQVRDVQGLLFQEERDGLTRHYGYDENGNLVREVDFDGSRTKYEYSSFNHLTKIVDPNNYFVTLEYNKQDELHAVQDVCRTWTKYPRDLHGEVKGVSRWDTWKEGYKCDGEGRLIEKTDAEGRKLYDIQRGPQGEVLERTFASGGFESLSNSNCGIFHAASRRVMSPMKAI